MKQLALVILAVLVSPFVSATSELTVQHPYARATPPNAPTSAVFLTLVNNSDQVQQVVSASTPAAGRVELHTHIMEGDVMMMRQVPAIEIPAHGETILKPGGLHIMLFDLKHAFTPDQKIEVTITLASGKQQTFTAKIKKIMKGMMSKH